MPVEASPARGPSTVEGRRIPAAASDLPSNCCCPAAPTVHHPAGTFPAARRPSNFLGQAHPRHRLSPWVAVPDPAGEVQSALIMNDSSVGTDNEDHEESGTINITSEVTSRQRIPDSRQRIPATAGGEPPLS